MQRNVEESKWRLRNFSNKIWKITEKFNDYKEEKTELTEDICDKTNATLVRIIGNIAILYRPAEKDEDRRYHKVI